ncbi:hypothetical protein NX862_13010 [Rhodobacter sp. KR11]|uniref:hypothetical protein n=1 Tax=Rhodobacter sp. KR11 TaxID=2974588 RepID=UPI0022214DEA|nr:hypothetical protein [Rhodobacter sp. KR11]MCW1919676.1 hypothetical protein [Rhodobacter sp. KR11]
MKELRYLWQNASNGQDRCGPRLFTRSAVVLAALSVPVLLPGALMVYARPPIADWTHGTVAILTFLIFATPLFFFARQRSFPGPNPYGPIPSEAFK